MATSTAGDSTISKGGTSKGRATGPSTAESGVDDGSTGSGAAGDSVVQEASASEQAMDKLEKKAAKEGEQKPLKTRQTKIATYLGPTQHTRILDRKTVNKHLHTALQRDLVFEESNRWTVDVGDVPQEVLDDLEADADFKLEDREVADDED